MRDPLPSDAVHGPLSGLLVIDLTHVINGPFGTMVLADLGARVIKVEAPGHGDDTRQNGPWRDGKSVYYANVNRGKESIVLDLKDQRDRALLVNMLKRADVLAENYRPGVMERLGFSWEQLQQINPRLIYASSSGFGHTGPLASAPAYDTIIQAMSGLMAATGAADGPPTRVGTSLADIAAGLFMYAGIATALYERAQSGRGRHVDIAMFDATLAFLEHPFMAYGATGKAPERIGNRHPSMAPFDVFQARDRPFVICCGNDRLFGLLCAALGRPGLASDPRFATNPVRNANQGALKALLEEVLLTRGAQDWIDLLHAAGVPVGPLLDVAEAAELPQTAARHMVVDAGGIRMPGNPIKISGYDDPLVRPPAPELDQHGPALRQEFAFSDGRADKAG